MKKRNRTYKEESTEERTITQMTITKIKGFGWRRDHLDARDRHMAIADPSIVMPSAFDMRTATGTAPLLPPVYDQGDLGSCVSNATAAAIDFERARQGLPFLTPSRLFIYYNIRVIEGTVGSDAGAEVRDGIKVLAAQGACPESEWPYVDSELTVQPTAQCYTDATKFEAIAYSRVNQTLYALKYAISKKKRPVPFGFTCYAQIQSEQAAQTGVITMPASSDTPIGGHCVGLVGFNDRSAEFTFRNSWGPGWGDSGYGYIPYAYVLDPNLSSDFWIILNDQIAA